MNRRKFLGGTAVAAAAMFGLPTAGKTASLELPEVISDVDPNIITTLSRDHIFDLNVKHPSAVKLDEIAAAREHLALHRAWGDNARNNLVNPMYTVTAPVVLYNGKTYEVKTLALREGETLGDVIRNHPKPHLEPYFFMSVESRTIIDMETSQPGKVRLVRYA